MNHNPAGWWLDEAACEAIGRKGVCNVARTLGVDQSIVSLWRVKRRPVPKSRVDALAAALGITRPQLLEGAEQADWTRKVKRANKAPARLNHRRKHVAPKVLPTYDPSRPLLEQVTVEPSQEELAVLVGRCLEGCCDRWRCDGCGKFWAGSVDEHRCPVTAGVAA